MHEFPKKMFIATYIEPIDCKTWYNRISRQTKRYGGDMPRTSRTTENVYAVKAHVLSQDLAPTEQFLEYPEKLIFRDGNDS